MSTDNARDLLPAWALDAVDDLERAAVERAIRSDPDLAEEARALKETTAQLAEGDAVPAPDRVRAAVLSEIASLSPARRPSSQARSARAGAGRGVNRWLAAAAALLVLAGIPTTLAVQQAQRAERAEQQVQAIAEALGRPGAELVRADVEGGGEAVAVVADDMAVFAANDLPALRDRDYQLWVIAGDDAPVSAGVVEPRDGRVTTALEAIPGGSSLAVTIEPPGGSEQPSTTPIVVLTTS